MTDLRFLIVNSNLQHAQQIIHELKKRVSFDVFQDTQDKNIWGLLEGGKDDVYVYDRCGRLAYYIPFPLSIMNNQEGDLVTSAILATYYRSPCGATCEKNSSTLSDFLNKVDREETQVELTTEESLTTTDLYEENLPSNQTEIGATMLETNSTLLEESFGVKVNESHVGYDYPTYDETLEDYDNNETDTAPHDHAFFNSLYSFFFNSDSKETSSTNHTLSTNVSSIDLKHDEELPHSLYNHVANYDTTENPRDEVDQNSVPLNISEPVIQFSVNETVTESSSTLPPKPKPDRCAEADQSICKDWSKKRLLRAHDCCSTIEDGSGQHQMMRYCKNFGKKRCKKIKTILKCCIKTALFESTTVPTDEEDTTMPTLVNPVTTDTNEVVCCRDVEEGRMCRVSEEPTCGVGEYLQEVVPQVEAAPVEDRVM